MYKCEECLEEVEDEFSALCDMCKEDETLTLDDEENEE